ncbi:MAG: hypothetical protein AAFQ22_11145 [Pseudomonadota bacterium]
MGREIDERKKRAALRKLRKAAALAESGLGPPLSDWEREFLEEVEARIETYGSAFGDPEKGDLEEPLSALQKVKLKEIDKKARGKGLKRGGFKRRSSDRPDDKEPADDAPPPKRGITPISRQAAPKPPKKPAAAPTSAKPTKPVFRVIDGGKSD